VFPAESVTLTLAQLPAQNAIEESHVEVTAQNRRDCEQAIATGGDTVEATADRFAHALERSVLGRGEQRRIHLLPRRRSGRRWPDRRGRLGS
jgi:hypothetical protein